MLCKRYCPSEIFHHSSEVRLHSCHCAIPNIIILSVCSTTSLNSMRARNMSFLFYTVFSLAYLGYVTGRVHSWTTLSQLFIKQSGCIWEKNYSSSPPLTKCQNKILVDLRATGEGSFLRKSGTLPDLFQETFFQHLELLFPRVCNNGKNIIYLYSCNTVQYMCIAIIC